jgi:two-component system response regulator
VTSRILLVEDTASDEKLTIMAFKRSGIANEVSVARDGAEALEILFAASELPSLVLLDLNLPKIDGLGVLRRIRGDERTRHLPVVILTSSKEDEDVVRGYALGANAYVRKPVDFMEFLAAAKTLGMFWLLLNQPPRPGGTA